MYIRVEDKGEQVSLVEEIHCQRLRYDYRKIYQGKGGGGIKRWKNKK